MEEGRAQASAGTSACVISLSPDHQCRPCFAWEETVSEKVRNVVCSACQQEHRFQTLCRLQIHALATPHAEPSPQPGMAAGFSLNSLCPRGFGTRSWIWTGACGSVPGAHWRLSFCILATGPLRALASDEWRLRLLGADGGGC